MKNIKYILSSLIIMFLTGCYPGEDFGVHVSMQVDEVETGLCSGNIISSYLIYDGNPMVSEVGICWEETSADIIPTVKKKSKKANNVSSPYSIMIEDLKELTNYVVRPYMQVDGFYVYGDSRTFRTPSNSEFLPKLGKLQLVKAELDKLSVTSSISSVPVEYPVTEVGVCYTDQSTSNFTPGMSGIKTVKAILSDGKFTVDVTDLTFSTTYRVRAYAKNQAGITYGNIESFRTAGDEYVPKLGEVTITKNAPTYLEVSCTVSEPLKTDSIKGWFEYSRSYNTPFTVEARINKGKMTAKIEGLQPSYNYSIVAKAENKFGVNSSQHKNVTTDSGEKSKPTISIPTITNITVDGAHAKSKIKIADSNYKALSGGFECSTSSYLHESVAKEGIIENDTILKLDLSDLSDNTTYYIRAYINTDLGKIYSTQVNFTTAEKIPSISELNVKSIHKTSVSLAALVKPYDENSSITEAGIQYTMYASINSGSSKVKGTIVGDSVFVNVDNLIRGTDYKMRAYAVSGNKYYYGAVQNIATKTDADYAPSFTNIVSSDVTMTTMSLRSTYTLVNDTYKVEEAGFQYYRSTNFNDISYGKLYVGDIKNETITLSVSDLVPGSTYQVRPYVKLDDKSIYYGKTIAVKTKQASDYAPIFNETIVSNLTMTSFELSSGYKLSNQEYNVTESGFQYYKSSYENNVSSGKLYAGVVVGGKVTLSISDLSVNSTYQVRPYVKMDNGEIYYGNTLTVKTKGAADYAPTASEVSVSNTLMTSAKLKANVKEISTSYPITEAGFQYYASTDSNSVRNGSLKSTTIENNTIQMNLESLSIGKTYQVRAYVKCSSGTYYGKISSFKTLSKSDLPSIICDDITAVSVSSFSIEANVKENHKSYPITEAGFLYIKSTSSSTLTLDTNNAIRKPITIQNGNIKLTVDGLEGNSTYLVRAYIMSGNEVTYNEKTIKVYTNMDNYKPTMGTLSVEKTNGEYVASCKAMVSQVFPIIDSGFVYSTSTYSPTLESNDGVISAQISESLISSKMPFEKPQTGNTIYYVRAYAKNANGITYSSYRAVTVSWND